VSELEQRLETILIECVKDIKLIKTDLEVVKKSLNDLGVKADRGSVMMNKFKDKLLD